VPVEKRIRQLIINLERARWISEDLGDRYIRINIPSFELSVVQEGQEFLTMRIIVGRSSWASPVFLSSIITYVETNPFWNVPSAIAEKEIWPRVYRDQNYLKKNRLKMIKRSDGSVLLRQEPGPNNSLGLIKIHFENDEGCYLHDTPEKGLFGMANRAFSHGCIRLENSFELATYLLMNEPGWDQDKLESTIKDGLRKKIYLSDPFPIFILYLTAWPDSSGVVQFRKDIYHLDSLLERKLQLPNE
jgi:murein L,D-transpeptidase YcbB/YkuD